MSPQEIAALAARNSGGGGWWGSIWGRANTKKEDGDLALQDLTASFGHDAEVNKVGSLAVVSNFCFRFLP